MKTLILTVGLPRSGKTTWAQKQGHPIVNPDSIRLAMHGQPFIKECESMIWVIAPYMVKSLFLAGHDTVIIDATNITKERRHFWNDKFPDCKLVGKHFDISKDECIRRAIMDERKDLIPIIERMAKECDVITI